MDHLKSAKDFDFWNVKKKSLHFSTNVNIYFQEQEIWWCSLGINIGVEVDGRHDSFERPVLIFRKFNSEMFWGLPVTAKNKVGKFYYNFILHKREQTIIMSQIKALSSRRLIRRLGKLSDKQFLMIKKIFTDLNQ